MPRAELHDFPIHPIIEGSEKDLLSWKIVVDVTTPKPRVRQQLR